MSEHRKRRRMGSKEAAMDTNIERERVRSLRWTTTSSRGDEESFSSKRSMLALVNG